MTRCPRRPRASDELVALAGAVRRHEGTTLEFIPGMGEIGPEGAALMADMSLAGNRPLNWNLLGNLSPDAHLRPAADRLGRGPGAGGHGGGPHPARHHGDAHGPDARSRCPAGRTSSPCPLDERRRLAADPAVRAGLLESAGALSARGLGAAEAWDLIEIGPADDGTTTAAVGRTVAEVAADRGVEPLDVVIDDVAGAGLHLTLLFPSLEPTLGRSDEGWAGPGGGLARSPHRPRGIGRRGPPRHHVPRQLHDGRAR